MDNTEYLQVLSLCSGMLGIERGIEMSGTSLRAVAYVEREAFIGFNLAKAMEKNLVDQAPIWTDIKTFNPRPFRNRVHLITGGYPCQGESYAGLREGEKYEGFIWPYIEQSIKSIKPICCFFENVSGHLSGTFPIVLRSLRNLGYSVEAGLFSAAEVGAPHQRQRLFILACSDIGEMRRCLANANSSGGSISDFPERNETIATSKGSNILANTSSKRSRKGCSIHEARPFNQKGKEWPARPGQQQWAWEEPRALPVESSMGCTINGVNFKNDLLRMYGNGVVPQAAAKAWITLTNKLINL